MKTAVENGKKVWILESKWDKAFFWMGKIWLVLLIIAVLRFLVVANEIGQR